MKPAAPALTITGSGTCWAILHKGAPVGGRYTSEGNAIAALRGVERRLAPAPWRQCLCCGARFQAPGYRLCKACRKEAS